MKVKFEGRRLIFLVISGQKNNMTSVVLWRNIQLIKVKAELEEQVDRTLHYVLVTLAQSLKELVFMIFTMIYVYFPRSLLTVCNIIRVNNEKCFSKSKMLLIQPRRLTVALCMRTASGSNLSKYLLLTLVRNKLKCKKNKFHLLIKPILIYL